ncbi:MAG: hypothetical protein KBF26_00415 [Opitutaceae bacterium]|nr:hypothetical protein [Opitutaceae bacterium]
MVVDAGQGGIEFSFPAQSGFSSYAVVALPAGYLPLALAEGGVVLAEDQSTGEKKRWINGTFYTVPLPPAEGGAVTSLMNRRGEVLIDYVSGDHTINALVTRNNLLRPIASGPYHEDSISAISNRFAVGTSQTGEGTYFDEDHQEDLPYASFSGALWNLAKTPSAVGGSFGHNSHIPVVPYAVNDNGDYLADHYDNQGNWLYTSLNGQELDFGVFGLNNHGALLCERQISGGAWRFGLWDGADFFPVGDTADWPMALNDSGDLLIDQSDDKEMLWRFDLDGAGQATYTGVDLEAAAGRSFDASVQIANDGIILMNASTTGEQPQPYLLVPAGLAVDADRDGVIQGAAGDTTSAEAPFRFWVNDDDDAITGSSDSDRIPRQSQDWTDHRIECERDLEDFARLQIYTQGLNEAFKNGDLHLGLKWTNTTGTPAIQIFRNRETDGGTGYLNTANNPNLPQQLVQWAVVDARTESQGPIAGQRTIEGSGVFILPSSLFANLTDAQPKTHLLFEGCKPGKGQLKLVILKKEGANYTEIGEGPGVWLDLKSIKSMYEGPGTTFEQPAGETSQGIVFVHGWNMSPEGSVNFAETMFKRLWHRGFKGRFVSLRWNTNYSDAFDNVPLIGEAVEGYLADYNGSERVAWQSGAIVKAAVDGLPSGYSRNIVAHSMGNIIAGSALLAGVTFDNYVLMQAAVPASCYDERALLQQAERPSPETYAGFRPTFWEAGVSPDDDPVPETRALSYRGRLSASVGNLVSFYLPDDHATTYAWEFNNDQTKPVGGYGYTRGAPVVLGSQRAIWRQIGTGLSAFQDSLTDPFVAMPFVCRSWSKVVGADSRTAGVIQSSFNLNSSPLFFDTEHSAQFNRSIQVLRPFYDELLRRLGMEPTP